MQTLNKVRGKGDHLSDRSKAVSQVHNCTHCKAHGVISTAHRRGPKCKFHGYARRLGALGLRAGCDRCECTCKPAHDGCGHPCVPLAGDTVHHPPQHDAAMLNALLAKPFKPPAPSTAAPVVVASTWTLVNATAEQCRELPVVSSSAAILEE